MVGDNANVMSFLNTYDGLYKVLRIFLWLSFAVYAGYEITQFPGLPLHLVAFPLESPLLPHLAWMFSIPAVLWAARNRTARRSYYIAGSTSLWMLSVYTTLQGAYDFSVLDVVKFAGLVVFAALVLALLSMPGFYEVRRYCMFLGVGIAFGITANIILVLIVPSLGGGEDNFIHYTPVMLFLLPLAIVAIMTGNFLLLMTRYVRPKLTLTASKTAVLGICTGILMALTGVVIGEIWFKSFYLEASFYILAPAVYAAIYCVVAWPILRKVGIFQKTEDLSDDTYAILWASLIATFTSAVLFVGLLSVS